MAEQCTSDCSSCGQDCPSRKTSFLEEPNKGSHIKKVIGVVSGKGGVGKSLMTSLLAVAAAKKGKKAGILDADITGPSIPHVFGVNDRAYSNGEAILPITSYKAGIPLMSVNLILENAEDPVIWRGAMISGVVKQFWTEVAWGDLDYLFVDMPPGTGDVPLTVFQSLPVDGIVIVTSPQDLVSMVVEKAIRMAEAMSIPVLGIVENMSYALCPDCGKKLYIFGEGKVAETAKKHGVEKTASLPILPEIAALCDEGRVEEVSDEVLDKIYSIIEEN